MEHQEKLRAFEYFLLRLVQWHRDVTGDDNNDLSTLKVLKLLFFVSAVDSNDLANESLLDDVFDNFHAMPYGHVESDIYDMIRNHELTNVTVNNKNTTIVNEDFIDEVDPDLRDRIDRSIRKLKEINPTIILRSSFDLVDLSHSWYSWQFTFKKARNNELNSWKIDPEIIKGEEKLFTL